MGCAQRAHSDVQPAWRETHWCFTVLSGGFSGVLFTPWSWTAEIWFTGSQAFLRQCWQPSFRVGGREIPVTHSWVSLQTYLAFLTFLLGTFKYLNPVLLGFYCDGRSSGNTYGHFCIRPWNIQGKESRNQGKNKVKKLLGKQSPSWVLLIFRCWTWTREECGTFLELETMLLVQLSVHPHEQLCCIFGRNAVPSWGVFI